MKKEFDQKAAETSKLEEMKLKLESDPANNDLRVEIAQYAIDNGSYEQAIETLLDVRIFSVFIKHSLLDYENR